MAEQAEPAESAQSSWRRYSRLTLPAIALLTALTMASLPWPWGLRISGSLTAGAVTLQLERDLTWPMEIPLAPARAMLTGSTWIDPPPEIAPTPLPEHGAIITAGELRLADLHLGRNGLLTLERSADRTLRITTSGAAGSMMLEANGKLVLKPDDGAQHTATLDGPSSLTVGLSVAAAAPLVLTAASRGAPAIEDVPVALLRFSKPEAAGSGETVFISSIIAGTVKLVDTGRSEPLERGAALVIQGFRGVIIRIDGTEESWRVDFSGRASRLRLGPPGFDDDLTPSILEYLFHQEWIKVMWASALAGLAALAEVRSWFGNKRG